MRAARGPRLEWERSGATPAAAFVPASAEPLIEFMRWYGAHGPAWPMPPGDGLWFTGGLPGVTLYCAGAFQVQLFIFPAGTEIPEHRHPHVDTVECHVAGDADFRVEVGGALVPAVPARFLHDRRASVSRWWGRGVRVRPATWHELSVGAAGAAFLSVQHWLAGAPSSVGLDWEGRPVNARHGAALCR